MSIKYFTNIFSVLLLVTIFFVSSNDLYSQRYRIQKGAENVYKDEYSELDDRRYKNPARDRHIKEVIEKSKQMYFQGLILIEKGDSAKSAEYFNQAVEHLNILASYPEVEHDEDYIDISQALIEDYELFFTDTKYINEDSPLFIIKEQLFARKSIVVENFDDDGVFSDTTDNADSIDSFEIDEYAGLNVIPDSMQIPLEHNKYVQKNIEFVTNKYGRKFFAKWLGRSTKWFPMMKRIAKDLNIPEDIIYLSMIESALDPIIVSRAKAVGLWQFIRSTGKMYGLNAGESYWLDERRDPEKATRAAMTHLLDLYSEFGDWYLSLAAYNCGPGCVQRAIRRSRIQNPTYWEIRRYLPRETRHYVPLYIATAKVAKDPEAYDFDLDTINYEDEYVYEVFRVDSAVSISALAQCAGITEEEFRALNPELIRNATPPDVSPYYVKIPQGIYDDFAEKFKNVEYEEIHPFVTHSIKRGETLGKIASRYGVSIQSIVSLNNMRSSRQILRVGQLLEIPVDPSRYNKSNERVTINPNEDVVHTVKKGESLYSISRRYGVNISDLRNFNNMSYNNDNLAVGQKLIIAKKKSDDNDEKEKSPSINEVSTDIVKHTVRNGETLGKIADDYGVSVNLIKNDNSLNSSRIYPGQVLKITKTGNKNFATNNTGETKTIIHKVRKGETLSTIAALHGVTERSLKLLNPNTIKGNTIYTGTNIKVETEAESKGSASAKDDNVKVAPIYYTVKKNDTLVSIARKFGVTVSSIEQKNNHLNPRRLMPGQKIRIK